MKTENFSRNLEQLVNFMSFLDYLDYKPSAYERGRSVWFHSG